MLNNERADKRQQDPTSTGRGRAVGRVPGGRLRKLGRRGHRRPNGCGQPSRHKLRHQALHPTQSRRRRIQLVEVRFEVAASAFEVGAGRMAYGSFSGTWATVVRRAKDDSRARVSALAARMAQHRQPHRSGEYQQGQKATEQPMNKRTFHHVKIRTCGHNGMCRIKRRQVRDSDLGALTWF